MGKPKGIFLVLLSTAVYAILFVIFRNSIGDSMAGLFLLLPILSFSWVFGLTGGVIFAVFSVILHFIFAHYIVGEVSRGMFFEHFFGGVVIVFISYLVGYLKDSHDKLTTLEEKARALNLGIEKSDDVIYITDSEGIIKYANPAFTKTYGFTEEDWKGKTPRILKSGYRDREFYEDFWQKIKKGESMRTDMRNMTKEGKILEIESSVNPIVEEDGKVIGFLAIQRDVTAKRALELELKKRAEDLQKLNELMVDRELKMSEMKKEIKNLTKN